MRRWALVTAGLVVVFAFLLPRSAFAAPPPPLDCKKVEAAQAKKKASRLATLLAVAACHHKAGKYTAAWYEYAEAAARARDAKDKAALKVAQKGERENAGLLAWITVKSDDDLGVFDIDGEKTVAGAKKAVDPGKHTVTASGPNRKTPWTKNLELQAGDVEEVDVPAPEPVAVAESTPPTPAPVNEPPPALSTTPPSSSPVPKKDKPAPSQPERFDPYPDHTGFVADLETLLELYKEQPPNTQNREGGQAYVFVPTLSYDFMPSLRAYAKWGLVDNYRPGLAHATALANVALGARYSLRIADWLKGITEAGLILPTGNSGGDDPNVGDPIRFANLRARALNPALFDPNYITPYVGLGAVAFYEGFDASVDLTFMPSFKTGGLDQDKSKSRLVVGLHGGWWVIPQLEPFLEVRWFRFLSSNAAIDADSALADTLFGGLGVGARLASFRLQLVYLRAIDAPLIRDDFAVLSLRLGYDF